jgi:hypothetical protein
MTAQPPSKEASQFGPGQSRQTPAGSGPANSVTSVAELVRLVQRVKKTKASKTKVP